MITERCHLVVVESVSNTQNCHINHAAQQVDALEPSTKRTPLLNDSNRERMIEPASPHHLHDDAQVLLLSAQTYVHEEEAQPNATPATCILSASQTPHRTAKAVLSQIPTLQRQINLTYNVDRRKQLPAPPPRPNPLPSPPPPLTWVVGDFSPRWFNTKTTHSPACVKWEYVALTHCTAPALVLINQGKIQGKEHTLHDTHTDTIIKMHTSQGMYDNITRPTM